MDRNKKNLMTTEDKSWLHWFRHSASYINAHRGKTIVLAMSGETLDHENLTTIIHDIALLNSLGVRLVIVFGARPQIDQALARAGIQTRLHHGLRVTPESAMAPVLAAVGALRARLEAYLTMGVVNSPMHGAGIRALSGNLVFARPMGVLDGVDLGYTGRVRKVDHEGIRTMLDHRAIVLVPSVGYSLTGEAFNLGLSDVASSVSEAIQADKLVVYCKLNELAKERKRELTLAESEAYLAEVRAHWEAGSEHRELWELAVQACRRGVRRCHMVDYRLNGALIDELFTRDGSGIMIHDDEYEQLRSATIDDIPGIQALLTPLEAQGVLIRRTRELLENEIGNFIVDERDGMIIGCAALYPFMEDNVGELACFAVSSQYQKAGRGDAILRMIESRAKQRQLKALFVLTTQAEHWFRERGFEARGLESLPASKRKNYNPQRNSKIFFKSLD